MPDSLDNLSALRYHQDDIDLTDDGSVYAHLVRLAGADKEVLEVGPATGYLTSILSERGCKVTCIERDATAAKVAAKHCARMIVADIEALDLDDALGGAQFDVVLLGDVLGYLIDPVAVLRRLARCLRPGGHVVASVPNVAHGSVRLRLFDGRFQYTDTGLLDQTRLRFFTRDSLATVFADAGYVLDETVTIRRGLFDTEQGLRQADYPTALVDAVNADPEATAYQWVVSASPAAAVSGSTSPPPANAEGAAVSRALQERLAEMDATVAHLTGRVSELTAHADNLSAQQAEMTAHAANPNSPVTDLTATGASRASQAAELTAQVEDLTAAVSSLQAQSARDAAALAEERSFLADLQGALTRQVRGLLSIQQDAAHLEGDTHTANAEVETKQVIIEDLTADLGRKQLMIQELTARSRKVEAAAPAELLQRSLVGRGRGLLRALGGRIGSPSTENGVGAIPPPIEAEAGEREEDEDEAVVAPEDVIFRDEDAPIVGWLEGPKSHDTVDRLPCVIEGWVLGREAPIDRVEIYVDSVMVELARLGLPRLDVAGVNDLPLAPVCGFRSMLDLTHLPETDTETTIAVMAYDQAGRSFEVAARQVKLGPAPRDLGVIVEPSQRFFAGGGAGADNVRPRIACFTHDLGYGGGQLYLFELMRQMQRQADLDFVVVSPINGPLAEDFEALGMPVEIMAVPRILDPVRFRQATDDLADWIKISRFDAVIGNTLLAFAPILAAAEAGVPSIWAIHESYPLPMWCALNGGWSQALIEHMVAKLEAGLASASAMIFESNATRDMFLPYADPDRMLKVTYGIDIEEIDAFVAKLDREAERRKLGFRSDDRVIVCIATFEQRKQQTVLAQAFAAVAQRHPDAKLVLIGDFPSDYSDALHDYLDRSGLRDRVTTFPIMPDTFRWYAISDLFALVSDTESMPRSLLESMAFGVPAFAASVFGVPELIEEGVQGFLTTPNSLGEIERKLEAVLSLDHDELAAVGQRARELIVREHDSRSYASVYLRLIDGLRRNRTPRDIVSEPASLPGRPGG